VTIVTVPDRIRDADDAGLAAEEALLSSGVAGERPPGPPPTTARRHTPFLAPYWHLDLRLHEAVIGRTRRGDLEAEAWSAPLHVVRPGAGDGLLLPGAGKLPDLLDAAPAHEHAAPAPHLPLAGGPEAIDEEVQRLEALRIAPSVEPLARNGRIARGPVHLLLRPFHLLEAADGRGGALLLDGASRSIAATLDAGDAERIRRAVRHGPLPATGKLAFRPMRCPVCASPLALSGRGETRFCPGCRRALDVAGEQLVPVPYRAETPGRSRPLLLPFWRFRFTLTDPRDGRGLRAVDQVVEAAGGSRAASPSPASVLDVPAFRSEDRRRQFPGLARHPGPFEPGAADLVDGPVRSEAGFPEPARFAALSSTGAALVARHVLLLAIPRGVLARAAPRRLSELLFGSRLALGPPELVLRALRSDALAP
jgi:hypothetical protein